jgi:hypothetical protein
MRIVDKCLSPSNKARFLSLAASHPNVPRLPNGLDAKMSNIVSTNSYAELIENMFDSLENDFETGSDDYLMLVYSSFSFKFVLVQLTNNTSFSVSFVTKPSASITLAVPTATEYLMRENVLILSFE